MPIPSFGSFAIMLLGPIYNIEMVTASRKRRYFALRVIYGLIILFVLWTSYKESSFYYYGNQRSTIQQAAQQATSFFFSFSWLQMFAILFVGPALAAGTIATERERRTIEYLFTTDLRNHEIVFGKLLAKLTILGQFVLVGLPILFIFRLLGGIPANLLVASFLLAASTAVMLASLSVCISVWSTKARDATIRVYTVLAALLILPGIFAATFPRFVALSWFWESLLEPVNSFCMKINPMWTLGMAMGNRLALGSGFDLTTILEAVGCQLLFALACVAWATMAVRRVHLRDSSSGSTKQKQMQSFKLPLWRPKMGDNPMRWKEMFAGAAKTKLGFAGNLALGLILLTTIGFAIYGFWATLTSPYNQFRRDDYFSVLVGITGLLGSGILLLLGGRAAGLVTLEKEQDSWLSLLATPLTGKEIIQGKALGNVYSMRWPFFVLMICWGLAVLLMPSFILVVAVLVALFIMFAWYVSNLGILFSLRSKTTMRSMGATLGTLFFTSGGYMFCCCAVAMGGGGSEIFLAPCIPFLLLFPTFAFVGPDAQHVWDQPDIPLAFLVGVILYIFATVMIYGYLISNFDKLSGRTIDASDHNLETSRKPRVGAG